MRGQFTVEPLPAEWKAPAGFQLVTYCGIGVALKPLGDGTYLTTAGTRVRWGHNGTQAVLIPVEA
jgi:hypothetical protein